MKLVGHFVRFREFRLWSQEVIIVAVSYPTTFPLRLRVRFMLPRPQPPQQFGHGGCGGASAPSRLAVAIRLTWRWRFAATPRIAQARGGAKVLSLFARKRRHCDCSAAPWPRRPFGRPGPAFCFCGPAGTATVMIVTEAEAAAAAAGFPGQAEPRLGAAGNGRGTVYVAEPELGTVKLQVRVRVNVSRLG